MAGFQIANKTVGKHAPVFNSFETGINHDGKWDQAFARIDAASEAGAYIIKFQMFQANKTAAGRLSLGLSPLSKSRRAPCCLGCRVNRPAARKWKRNELVSPIHYDLLDDKI